MEVSAALFSNRESLDAHIQSLPDKTGVVIVGTEDEFRAKHLSESTTVWGVPCKIISGDNQ